MMVDKGVLFFLNALTGNIFYLDLSFFFFAQIVPYLIAIPFLYLLLRNIKKHGWFAGEVLLAGFFTRYALVELVRYAFPRERPFQVFEEINLILPFKDSPSYPSGHIAFLFAISTIVLHYNERWGIALYSLSFLSAISRVITGVHWPLDVLCGALLGILGGIIVRETLRYIKKEEN